MSTPKEYPSRLEATGPKIRSFGVFKFALMVIILPQNQNMGNHPPIHIYYFINVFMGFGQSKAFIQRVVILRYPEKKRTAPEIAPNLGDAASP